MKKYISVALMSLMALFVAAPAQAGIFSWGIEGGMNLSKMSISKDAFKSDNRTGWFAGVKGEIAIPLAGLAVDGAVLYSQKYMDLNDEEASKSKTMPYLEVPVNLKWKFGFSSLLGIYIATGPQWNYYLGGKTFSLGEDWEGKFKETTFSWNIGAGVNAFSHLTVGANVNIPLGNTADVSEKDAIGVAKSIDMKDFTYQVRATYWF